MKLEAIKIYLEQKSAEYKGWLKLPRYQDPQSDEYYADIQAITEDLDNLIRFIDQQILENNANKSPLSDSGVFDIKQG
ncbi:MAG: hypothetical protein UR73_C0038G0007 [candidate division WS6 bacterium GW2011_GWF1_35_23]|uniref:Uncharacterized protein n=1 Tax=candidate division WS6 bacterium GW2011_GWF1_35_23 TaxID=1619097 RepID=A0A0G0BYY3_9BACT|nr:MAG: hypothetical protein UR73_C0038G0007 [candidate division WS6 bacterium GW2011_GWF1_35_23]KKQ29791.1 MAG: hypothetical protein US46_C0017G0007 [Candidatus Shapirobacteria bacterium GW2011_GWF2_37_20]